MNDLSAVPVDLGAITPMASRLTWAERAGLVGAVAAEWAGEVDRDARFPEEAFAAAQEQRLLSLMIPTALGGEGQALRVVTDLCYKLGRHCSATAMVFAMHQCCIACLVRHAGDSPWHQALLRRVAADQLLLASSTTEGNSGGDLRTSQSAIVETESGISLERAATVMSYGARADGVVTTARRAPDAAPSDQVLVAFLRSDYTLTPVMTWDALGMRGTCSGGFAFHAEGEAQQVLPQPYDRIHGATMVPVHHLVWSSVWTGIAAGAVERAQAFVRRVARKSGGTLPPGAGQLTNAHASLMELRAVVAAALRGFEQREEDEAALRSLDFQAQLNLLKVRASELAVATVLTAGRACGLAGYRNDSEFSMGRHLRDILSAPIMIHNDRILANLANVSLVGAIPAGLDN